MPSRVRDRHLAQVLEALIRYAAGGNALTFQSERDDQDLRITFHMRDAESFHETLSAVMAEEMLQEPGARGESEQHADAGEDS